MNQSKDSMKLAVERKTDTPSSESPITLDDTWRDVDSPKPFYLSFVNLYVAIIASISNLMVQHNILGKLIFLVQSVATYTNRKIGVNIITIDAEIFSAKILDYLARVDEELKSFLLKFDVWFDLFRNLAVKAVEYVLTLIEPYLIFAAGSYTFVTSFAISKFEQIVKILRRLISIFRRVFQSVYDVVEYLVLNIIVTFFAFFQFCCGRKISARYSRGTIQSNFDVTKHEIDNIIFRGVVQTLKSAKICALAISTRVQPALQRFQPHLEQLRTNLIPYIEKLQQIIIAQRENSLYGAAVSKVLDFSSASLSEAGILWTAPSYDEGELGRYGLEGDGTAEVALDIGASDATVVE